MTATAPEEVKVEDFKARTERKVRDVLCPKHGQPPRLLFHGSSLKDISIRMSGCCEQLIEIANQKIAGR